MRDLTFTFSRLAGFEWTPPDFEAIGLDENLGNDLVLSRNIARWSDVSTIAITFYGAGRIHDLLDLNQAEKCRKVAAGALDATANTTAGNGLCLGVPIEAVLASSLLSGTLSQTTYSPCRDASSIPLQPTKTIDAPNSLPANLVQPFSKLSKLIWLEKELARQPSPHYEQSQELLDILARILGNRMTADARMAAGARMELEIGRGLSNEQIWELFKLAELRAGVEEVKSARDEIEALKYGRSFSPTSCMYKKERKLSKLGSVGSV